MLRFTLGLLSGAAVMAVILTGLAVYVPLTPRDDLLDATPPIVLPEISAPVEPVRGSALSVPPILPSFEEKIALPLPSQIALPVPIAPAASDLPRLSVVVHDKGQIKDAGFALAALPYPVAVVLDASLPDAAARSASYRANGIEVLSLGAGDLPEALGRIFATEQGYAIEKGPTLQKLAEKRSSLSVEAALKTMVREGAGSILAELRPEVLAGLRIFSPSAVAVVPVSQQIAF